jgi:ACDE family multidrug resistance protein
MADEGGRDQPVYRDHNLHVVWGVTLMSVLGTSSVTPAFPKVIEAFGISPGQVWQLIAIFSVARRAAAVPPGSAL